MKASKSLLVVCATISAVASAAPVPIYSRAIQPQLTRRNDVKGGDEGLAHSAMQHTDTNTKDGHEAVLNRRVLGWFLGKSATKVAQEGAKQASKQGMAPWKKIALGVGATALGMYGYGSYTGGQTRLAQQQLAQQQANQQLAQQQLEQRQRLQQQQQQQQQPLSPTQPMTPQQAQEWAYKTGWTPEQFAAWQRQQMYGPQQGVPPPGSGGQQGAQPQYPATQPQVPTTQPQGTGQQPAAKPKSDNKGRQEAPASRDELIAQVMASDKRYSKADAEKVVDQYMQEQGLAPAPKKDAGETNQKQEQPPKSKGDDRTANVDKSNKARASKEEDEFVQKAVKEGIAEEEARKYFKEKIDKK